MSMRGAVVRSFGWPAGILDISKAVAVTISKDDHFGAIVMFPQSSQFDPGEGVIVTLCRLPNSDTGAR